MKKILKKKAKLMFTFTEDDAGYFMDVKANGDLKLKYIEGLKEFINRFLEDEYKKDGENKGK